MNAETCSLFLSRYAAMLLGCGATCIRIEKNVRRMAKAFGVEVGMSIMPSHILLSVWGREHRHPDTCIERMHRGGISFLLNARLSKPS